MSCTSNHREQAKLTKFCPECGIALEAPLSDNPDYVTTLACVNPHRAIVAVMHYNKADDSYVMKKCSDPLPPQRAKLLADSWAAALKVEVR